MGYRYIPLNFSLDSRSCLVVGGGNVALRKIETLLDYDTRITVVAPQTTDKIDYFAQKGRIRLEKREYRSPEAGQYGIVISASDDNDTNYKVHEDCRRAGVPVNVVDNPALCDFIFPAVIRRDCLTIAVSTDGMAPFLSGHLRTILGNIFPDHWTKIAKYASSFRQKVRHRWSENRSKRLECYGRFLEADWKSLIKEKNEDELNQELDQWIET